MESFSASFCKLVVAKYKLQFEGVSVGLFWQIALGSTINLNFRLGFDLYT